MSDRVMTVLGPVDAGELGVSHMHEHLILDMFTPNRNPAYSVGVLQNIDLAVEELQAFKQAGGSTVVEVTNMSLGRDVLALKQIAKRTGVHIIAATGYYTEVYYTRDVFDASINQLADKMIKDIVEGVDNTGVRAGIIGEIGTIGSSISHTEEKVFRAAARAQRATGAPLTTHTRLGNLAQEQLDILEDEGVDLHRVIIGHQDGKWDDPAYHEAIARRGAYVEFDCVGEEHYSPTLNLKLPTNVDRVHAIVNLVQRGYESQILLSSDICKTTHLHKYGGWGYDHLLKEFVPMLEQAGIGPDTITMMLVRNPRQVLPI